MSFSAQIDAFCKKSSWRVAKVFEAVSLELYDRIVNKTPVDTGRARANWNLSLSTPDTSVSDSTVRKHYDALLGVSLTKDNVSYISNYLHYIYELEHGKSNQAPQGMVTVSMIEIKLWLNTKLGTI